MNNILTPLKLLELTYGGKVDPLKIIQNPILEVNAVSQRWKDFVENTYNSKVNEIERIKVLTALTKLTNELDPLSPTFRNSIENIKVIMNYIENQK